MSPLSFKGLRDYRTGDAKQLRQDLQRQNLAVAESLAQLDAGRSEILTPKDAPGSVTADYGDLLVSSGLDVTVTLPKSVPARAGRRVGVAYGSGASGSLFVAAASGDTVSGIDKFTISSASAGQLFVFTDNGDGQWWRS